MKFLFKIFSFFFSVMAFGYLLPPIAPAQAHPQPLVAQEFLFNFSPEGIEFTLLLRMDSLVVDQVYPQIDLNSSGDVNRQEIEVFAQDKVLNKTTIRLNNKDVKFELTGQIKTLRKNEIKSLDDYFEIHFVAIEPNLKESNYFYFKQTQKYFPEDPYGDLYSYDDNIFANPRLENLDVDQLTTVNGEEYNASYKIVDYVEPKNDSEVVQKNALTELWEDFKNSSTYFVNQAKEIDFNNPFLVMFALLILLVAGALHALTPGHGKSMLAAFLVGKKQSKFKDVLILAVSITLAHTAVIYILGFTLLAIGQTSQAQTYTLIIEKLSAWLMIFLSLVLIYRGYKSWKHMKMHSHGEHHHHDHEHHHGHHHHHNEDIKIKNDWDLFYAGISGGIVPCLDALSILLLFVSLGKVAIGLMFVFVFSLGLALAIIALGLALLYGKEKMNLEEKLGEKAEIIMPFISGGIILIISVIYLLTK